MTYCNLTRRLKSENLRDAKGNVTSLRRGNKNSVYNMMERDKGILNCIIIEP